MAALLHRLAFVYAASRTAFGSGALVAPGPMFRRSAGPAADTPITQSYIRNFGVRDVVLGVVLWRALQQDEGARGWLLVSGLCGVVDFLALANARDDLAEGGNEMLALTAMDAVSGLGLAALTR